MCKQVLEPYYVAVHRGCIISGIVLISPQYISFYVFQANASICAAVGRPATPVGSMICEEVMARRQ